jgi:hypothetical protein
VSTGKFLGETIVFDPPQTFNGTYWGDAKSPGRRVIESGGLPLLDSDRCADEATLTRLDEFYQREWEANWVLRDGVWEQRRPAEDSLNVTR